MLPTTDSRDLNLKGSSSSKLMDVKFPDYIRRLCDFRQMDFDAAYDQILTLLSVEPQSVYEHAVLFILCHDVCLSQAGFQKC